MVPRRIYMDVGLPASSYMPFVSFLEAFVPGTVGEVSHGTRFLMDLDRSWWPMQSFARFLEHWAIIPALGMPSDFARVLNGYTCEGESCQILIHIVTRANGELHWLLVDIVPNANAKEAGKEWDS